MTDQKPDTSSIKSYVLRQGRLSSAQARYHALLMPKIGISYSEKPISLTDLFGKEAPIILEIGFGMGDATIQMAKASPQCHFLGIEVHTPGVGNLCKRIFEENVENIRIIQHDAVAVLNHMIPEGSLDSVHIFFPDPWPKKRHHKRRLIQAPLVQLLATRLKKGGVLHCATDWQDYAEQMLAVLSAEALLQNTSDGFSPRPDLRPKTKFEARGERLGHAVYDVVFRRI